MKPIPVKFYRIHKYTDPTGMFKITVEIMLTDDGKLIEKMTGTCDGFPDIVTLIGPFNPLDIIETEKILKSEESKGRIRNLVMEDEVTGVGFTTEKLTPEQIQMN